MRIEDIKIDLEQLKSDKEKNQEERMAFIEFWVDYVKKHSDKEWSRQQNNLIDSQVKSALSVKNTLKN
jgi:hypothetical protein